jgi:hypothetical protein
VKLYTEFGFDLVGSFPRSAQWARGVVMLLGWPCSAVGFFTRPPCGFNFIFWVMRVKRGQLR